MINHPRRHQLILTSSLGAILVSYFLFAWLPHRREMRQLKGQIKQTLDKVSGHVQQAQQMALLRNELAQLEAYNSHIRESLPANVDPTSFLAGLYRMAQENGVVLNRVEPQLENRLLELERRTIRLSLIGPFPAIARVIHRLETGPRMLELTYLEVDSSEPNTPPGHVEAVLDLTLFARADQPVASHTN